MVSREEDIRALFVREIPFLSFHRVSPMWIVLDGETEIRFRDLFLPLGFPHL